MPHTPLWTAYTQQVLHWRLGTPHTPPVENPAEAQQAARRIVRMHATSGRHYCVLLGVGDGTLANNVADALPADSHLLILESDMDAARAAHPRLPTRGRLLADASPWALFLLTVCSPLTAENCTIGWTLPATRQPRRPVLETWRHLFAKARRANLPPSRPVRLSVGCILHRDEPHLTDFFAHIPAWVHDVSVVWDAKPPASAPPCAAPVHAQLRPLGGDFAAQRNAMLARCAGDWCLYLDADERLEPDVWDALPRLMACANDTRHTGGVLFPRMTFEDNAMQVRMGYGLWPDVQLRLFPLTPTRPTFTGAVHERLSGLRGDVLLAPALPILHYSHIYKNRTELSQRLAVFNAAAGYPAHILSAAYPSLPRGILDLTARPFAEGAVLCLPLQAAPRTAMIGNVQQELFIA